MTEILGSLLLLSMLALMAARTASPFAASVTGETLIDVPLRPIFRLLDERTNIIAILAVLILGSGVIGERWISHGMFLFAVIVMIGVLVVPTHYRFTTRGISPNRSTFRTWEEFEAWEAIGNVIRLKGADRFGSLKLYVAENDRESVSKLLERYVPAGPKRRPPEKPSIHEPHRLRQRKGGTQ